MKAKEFKNNLYDYVSKELPDFKLIKSKELFQLKYCNHINNIYIYPTSYTDYFSIEVNCYYDNKKVREKLKQNFPNFKRLVDKGIVGSDCKKITNEIFKNTWNLEYGDYIYDKDESIEDFYRTLQKDINEIILPFFNLCNDDLFFVHKLLNGSKNNTGFGINYENKILKSLIIAEQCGISKNEIVKLANEYEKILKEKKSGYLNEFIELRIKLGY